MLEILFYLYLRYSEQDSKVETDSLMRSAVGTPVQTGVTHLPSRSVSPLKIRILHGMSRKLRGSEAFSYNFASRPHTYLYVEDRGYGREVDSSNEM